MPRKRNIAPEDQPRIAPGTIVGWFEGLTEHTGRVLLNIPGTQYKTATVIVKDGAGARHSLRTSRVHVKVRQD